MDTTLAQDTPLGEELTAASSWTSPSSWTRRLWPRRHEVHRGPGQRGAAGPHARPGPGADRRSPRAKGPNSR
ncbi:MAG: hypothetical protein R3A10_23000 [Caldilineaceae bacterium]